MGVGTAVASGAASGASAVGVSAVAIGSTQTASNRPKDTQERVPLLAKENTGTLERVEVQLPSFQFKDLVRDRQGRDGLPPRC